MKNSFRICMLVSDGFGGFGGISKFNVDFMYALDASEKIERTLVLPRIITDKITSQIPKSIVYDCKSANKKSRYISRLLYTVMKVKGINLVICGHLNLLSLAFAVSLFYRVPLVLIIHGIEAWKPRNWFVKLIARKVSSFISVSKFSAEKFASWSGVSIDRFFILPNTVDLDRFMPSARDRQLLERYDLGSSKVLLTVGRLDSMQRKKGFDEVLDVMPHLVSRVPTLKYLIVGDGPDRQRLVEKVSALRMSEHVIFAGKVSDQEKVAHYNLADLYVMPSSGEGFGIVLIEAAACGLPIVGSKTDGSREALLEGRLGRLVRPENRAELIEAVLASLENPRDHHRNDLVSTFSSSKFNARVAQWVENQIYPCVQRQDKK